MKQETIKVFSKLYVFDPRPRFSFRVTAKRYWTEVCLDDPIGEAQGDAVTLIFTHAAGFHKEHWEPTIQRLFENQHALPFRIEDMWSIDAPNQGDAAVLNEDVLTWGYIIFPWEDYGRGVHAFLTGLGQWHPTDVDFSKRKLVAVGHCMGAVALMLSMTFFPFLKFSSMHLIEPFLGRRSNDWGVRLAATLEKRKDIWASAEEAYQELKGQRICHNWDERVLRIYVEHGLRPLPTTEYPDRSDGVTLKCTKKQEAAIYRDDRSFSIAYKNLRHSLKDTPTHITYGEIPEFIPAEWKQDVLHNASGGIGNYASVTIVPGAGHLVVQTHPDDVADVIWEGLIKSYPPNARARL